MRDLKPIEAALEPDLPIVDAHHHLWLLPEADLEALDQQTTVFANGLRAPFRRHRRYLLDELLSDTGSGHNIQATVFVDAHAMYRQDGPEEFRSVGEVEFVNGVAAMAASGLFGRTRACAAIVGGVDLRLGARVEAVLHAHLQAGGRRYRGVRSLLVHDDDPTILGGWSTGEVLSDAKFREGFAKLAPLELSFDAFVFDEQLPELLEVAQAFPSTRIILNHSGAPLGTGRYGGQRADRFPLWRSRIRDLSRCDNVMVKLGGLGIPFGGFQYEAGGVAAGSSELAEQWRPYILACIEEFGPQRCMFESNFPVDWAAGSYSTVWNAFKRITADFSMDERQWLYSRTAVTAYRIDPSNLT